LDNEIDRKMDVTTILFLLVQNRHQTHNWTLIGSGATGLGIQESLYDAFPAFENPAFSEITKQELKGTVYESEVDILVFIS